MLEESGCTRQIAIVNQEIQVASSPQGHIAVSGGTEDYAFKGHSINARLLERVQYLEELFRIGDAVECISFELTPGAIQHIGRNGVRILDKARIEHRQNSVFIC